MVTYYIASPQYMLPGPRKMRYVIFEQAASLCLLCNPARKRAIKDLPLSRFSLGFASRLLRDSFMFWGMMPESWRIQPGVLECNIEELIEPEFLTSGNLLIDMMNFMIKEDIGFFNGQQEYIRLFGDRLKQADAECFMTLILRDLGRVDGSIVDFRSAVGFYLGNPVFRAGHQDNPSMSLMSIKGNSSVKTSEVANHLAHLFRHYAFDGVVDLLTTSEHWMMIQRDYPHIDISKYHGGRRHLVETDLNI